MDEAIVKDLRIVYNTPEGLNRYQKMLIQRKLKLFSEEYASIQHLNDIIQNLHYNDFNKNSEKITKHFPYSVGRIPKWDKKNVSFSDLITHVNHM